MNRFSLSLSLSLIVFSDDLPFRYMSEQVSHHPPVSAFQCDSRNNGERWRFYGSILPKAKFSLKNMEVNPKGLLTLELKRFPIDERIARMHLPFLLYSQT